MSYQKKHILLLGATGLSGIDFVKYWLTLSSNEQPCLTLYVRNESKLYELLPDLEKDKTRPNMRIIVGTLTDRTTFDQALSASGSQGIPPITDVISLLGPYPSLSNFILRDTWHVPIADAFRSTILPALRAHAASTRNRARILALSTPTALVAPGESTGMPWGWWFETLVPILFLPQGNAEMKGVADAVMAVNSTSESTMPSQIEWTVFRVPVLTDNDAGLEVLASKSIKDEGFTTNITLTRGSMVRWLLRETSEGEGGRKWVNQAPVLANK